MTPILKLEPNLSIPPIPAVVKACSPTPMRIQYSKWNALRADYHEPSDVVDAFDAHAKADKRVSFTVLGKKDRCPRRYPLICAPQDHFLLSASETKKLQPKVLMSALPKVLRPAVAPPEGMLFIDADIDAAHVAIFAMLSEDTKLADWLNGDPHQETGDFFLGQLQSPLERRKQGKMINAALMAGASAYRIQQALLEAGFGQKYSIIQEKVRAWWSRFPKALVYRQDYMAQFVRFAQKGEAFQVMWGNRYLLNFDKGLLMGKWAPYGWPDSVHERQWKAANSALTGLFRCYESIVMEVLFVEAHKMDCRLACPMYDGALWAVDEKIARSVAIGLQKVGEQILRHIGIPTGLSVAVRSHW